MKSNRTRIASSARLVGDALAGRLGLIMMTLVYGTLAVFLLAYVSTQVYTNSLVEDITVLERERREAGEQVGLLMQDYTRLVSRARISRICVDELGMEDGNAGTVVRVRFDRDAIRRMDRSDSRDLERVREYELLGSSVVGITEAMRR